MGNLRQPAHVSQDPAHDQDEVGDDEAEEDRHHQLHRLFHSPHVHDDQGSNHGQLDRHLEAVVRAEDGGEEIEEGVAPRGDRGGDGQHVVHQERGPRDHPRARPEQLGGHHVAPAAMRELLDDPGIGVGDDEHGDGGGQREEDGQVPLPLGGSRDRVPGHQVLEAFRRPVGRGGKAVGSQPDPGEEGDQGKPVEDPRVPEVPRRAEKLAPEPGDQAGLFEGIRRSSATCRHQRFVSPESLSTLVLFAFADGSPDTPPYP